MNNPPLVPNSSQAISAEAAGMPPLPPTVRPADDSSLSGRRVSPIEVVGLVAVGLGLVWSYWPSLVRLYGIWTREPDYSHGFLVLPISLVILWKLWPKADEATPAAWPAGWALVVGSLAARWFFHERGSAWSETATLLPLVVGLALARVGWRFFARIWPAFAFLVFLFPLPDQVNSSISQPLQGMATTFSCKLLRLSGLWVMPEGNVILVGNERLEVAAACNGLSMLMSLAATVAATATLLPMATLKRVLLLGSIIPIALFSNVLRITVTAWCYYRFGADVGSKYAHDIAGWAMMPLAMVLVGIELAIMSWVIIETTEVRRPETLIGFDRVRNSWNPGTGA